MSTEDSIYALLNHVMVEVGHVGKDARNPQGGYNFRGIDAVVNAVGPALRKYGVIVVPQVTSYEYGEIAVGKNRTPMGHARVVVAYTFYGPTGDSIATSAPGEAFDSGDKATPKAMSVAFRTALLQSLALPTDEPDPDSHSYTRSDGQQEAPPPPPDVDADSQRKRYHALRERLGWDEEAGHAYIVEVSRGQVERWRDLDARGRTFVLDKMQEFADSLGRGE